MKAKLLAATLLAAGITGAAGAQNFLSADVDADVDRRGAHLRSPFRWLAWGLWGFGQAHKWNGAAAARRVVLFGFLVGMAPEGVSVMTDISAYLSFVLTLFIAFGLAFETPVAIVLMVQTGLVTPAKLKSVREYVFIGAFVLGAIFTPPDIISQFMLAVPVYLLFELGIFVSRWVTPGIAEVEAQQRDNGAG